MLTDYLTWLMEANGFVTDIESDTVKNSNFRKVIFTAKHLQLVLMSVKDEIGEETHPHTDQFIRIDGGTGKAILDGKTHKLTNGSALVVPAGTKHNIICTSHDPLKLYTIYSPPHHPDGQIQKNPPKSHKS